MQLKDKLKLSTYRKFQIVSFTIMGIVLLYYLNEAKKTTKKMWENARYTIAVTNGTTQGLKSTFPAIHYYYYVKGIKCNSSFDISLKEHPIQTEGGRYLLVFSSEDYKNCEFLYNCSVPDSIKDAPDEGWKEAPFNCNVNE